MEIKHEHVSEWKYFKNTDANVTLLFKLLQFYIMQIISEDTIVFSEKIFSNYQLLTNGIYLTSKSVVQCHSWKGSTIRRTNFNTKAVISYEKCK